MGPEQGATLPGMTVVCGDSHTSTHGAFGALAFGIGTSEVEHVLATQTLLMKKAQNMRVVVDGKLAAGCTAKDIVLAIIGRIGTAGGTGYAIEFAGTAIEALSIEGRMTICNMAIEAGARSGLVAVDEKTIDYVRGRPFSPQGAMFEQAAAHLAHVADRSGRAVRQRRRVARRRDQAAGHLGHVTGDGGHDRRLRARSGGGKGPRKREGIERALRYMGLMPEDAHRRHSCRQGLHRFVHQLAHRGSARGSLGREATRQARGRQRQAGNGGSRLGTGEGAGRARGAA